MGIGEAWGTREELLHPRGPDGRFISKAKMGLGVVDALQKILDAFRPRTFMNDGQSAQYLRNVAKPSRLGGGAGIARFKTDFNSVQEDLRDGVINNPSTKRYVQMMDASAVDLPDDVILSRVVGPEAFGLTKDTMNDPENGIAGHLGNLLADRGYSPMNIGTPLQGPPGSITIVGAVPKGTRAIVPSTSLTDREVVLDRNQEFRVTKVTPDGRGGYYVQVVMTPRTPGETPVPQAGHVGSRVPSVQREAHVSAAEARLNKTAVSDVTRQKEAAQAEQARQAMLKQHEAEQQARIAQGLPPAGQRPAPNEHPQSGQPSPAGPTPSGQPNVPEPRTEPVHTQAAGANAPRATPAPSPQAVAPPPQLPAAQLRPEETPTTTPIPRTPASFRAVARDLPAPSPGPNRKAFNVAYTGVLSGRQHPDDVLRNLESDVEHARGMGADLQKQAAKAHLEAADMVEGDKKDRAIQVANRLDAQARVQNQDAERLQGLADRIKSHFGLTERQPAPAPVKKATRAAKKAAPEAPPPEVPAVKATVAKAPAAKKAAAKAAPTGGVPFHEQKTVRTPEEQRRVDDAILRRAAELPATPRNEEEARIKKLAAEIQAKRSGKAPEAVPAVQESAPVKAAKKAVAAKRAPKAAAPEAPAAPAKAAKAAVPRLPKPAKDETTRTKNWAKENGYVGRPGGWIYDKNNKPVAHGWDVLYQQHKKEIDAHEITRLREGHAAVAAKEAAAPDVLAQLHQAKTREEAHALLEGKTVAQLKEIYTSAGFRPRAVSKEALRNSIVEDVVGNRLASKAIREGALPTPQGPGATGLDKLAAAKTIADLRQVARDNNIDIPSRIKLKNDIRQHIEDNLKRAPGETQAAHAQRLGELKPGELTGPHVDRPVEPDRKREFLNGWNKAAGAGAKGSIFRQNNELRDDVASGKITPVEGLRRLENEIAFNQDELAGIRRDIRSGTVTGEELDKLRSRRNEVQSGIVAQEKLSRFMRQHFNNEPAITPKKLQAELPPDAAAALDKATPESLKKAAETLGLPAPAGGTKEEVVGNIVKSMAKNIREKKEPIPKGVPAKPPAPTPGAPNVEDLTKGLNVSDIIKSLIQMDLENPKVSLPAIGRKIEEAAKGPSGPAYKNAVLHGIHGSNLGGDPKLQAESKMLDQRYKDMLQLAERLKASKRGRLAAPAPPKPDLTPKETVDALQTAERIGVPAEQVKAGVLAKKVEAAAPSQHAQGVVDLLKTAKTREEAHSLLAGRTKAELVDVAKAANVAVGSKDTKAALSDRIVQGLVGRRLDSEAIGRVNMPGRAQPAAMEIPKGGGVPISEVKVTGPLAPLAKGERARAAEDLAKQAAAVKETGPQVDLIPHSDARNHGDSALGELWSSLPKNTNEERATANAVEEIAGSISRSSSHGNPNALNEAIKGIETLRNNAPENVRPQISKALRAMEGPPPEKLNFPDGTPGVLKQIAENLNMIPTARKSGRVGARHHLTSTVNSFMEFLQRMSAGDVNYRELDAEAHNIFRSHHESTEGAYQMWHQEVLWREATREIRAWVRQALDKAEAAAKQAAPGGEKVNFGNMTVNEIRDLARQHGVPGVEDLRRNDLIDALVAKGL